jgi:hypothetical protein
MICIKKTYKKFETGRENSEVMVNFRTGVEAQEFIFGCPPSFGAVIDPCR